MPQITNLSGEAGGTYASLKPAYGPGGENLHGPFSAALSPSIPARAAGDYPSEVFIGLLMSKPDPDGMGGKELDAPGYERQAVELLSRSRSHLCVSRPVLFEIFNCPTVTHLALFDGDGQIFAHGALRGRTTEASPPSRFEFPGHQILVRRPSILWV